MMHVKKIRGVVELGLSLLLSKNVNDTAELWPSSISKSIILGKEYLSLLTCHASRMKEFK